MDQTKTSPYQTADHFFNNCYPFALTYDDVSLAACYSEILPYQTHLETALSHDITLSIPIISADMDTVTESRLAIGMATQGGLGLIHYNMSPKEQVKEIARVKNHIHGLIQDPIKTTPDVYVSDILEKIEKKNYNFSTFPVTDEKGKLVGLVNRRAIKPRYKSKKISAVMTPRDQVYTIQEKALGKTPIDIADKFFDEHIGIHKLIVVDSNDHVRGLFTLSDIERITEEARATVKPARDASFRLLCGAAIPILKDKEGNLLEKQIIEHTGNLVKEGCDVIAISVAHGHTKDIATMVQCVRKNFKNLTLIAGNVTSAEGVAFLAKAGANVIKVGQGSGSICTTRIVAGVGVPQLTALYEASRIATKKGVKILADGGINKSGDIVKALTLADGVICGNLLAGCKESPGNIIEINNKLYKQYRGMGSHEAMKAGSAARYGHSLKFNIRKAAAEGIEALKEVSGSLDNVLTEIIGGLRSGMGYLGSENLAQLKKNARYIHVTAAGQRESAPHDVIELKTTEKNP